MAPVDGIKVERICKSDLPDIPTDLAVEGVRLPNQGLIEDSLASLHACESFEMRVKEYCTDVIDSDLEQLDIQSGIGPIRQLNRSTLVNADDLLEGQVDRCLKEGGEAGRLCEAFAAAILRNFNHYVSQVGVGTSCKRLKTRVDKTHEQLSKALEARSRAQSTIHGQRIRFAFLRNMIQYLLNQNAESNARSN